MEDEVKRVLALANRLAGGNAEHRGVQIEIGADNVGWTVRAAGFEKTGGTIHTALFALEHIIRERLKGKRADLQRELNALTFDDD
jgi:hypothetical protein